MTVADAAGKHDRSDEERAHRPDKSERVEPAGLAAGARRQQHKTVGTGFKGTLGMADRGNVGKDQRAGVMERCNDGLRRADGGDDELASVPPQHGKIVGKPRVGAMHDQVGTDRRRRLAVPVLMPAQPVFDDRQPAVELFSAAAVHRWKGADHAIAAGRDHEIDAGHQEHRSRNQRQLQSVAKARERAVVSQSRCPIAR